MSQLLQEYRAARFGNVAAQATTVHKSGGGVLHRIVVNKCTANGVLTVYDNTAASGTKIATITMPGTLLQNHFVLEYGLQFGTGLTIVGSGADVDYTAVWS